MTLFLVQQDYAGVGWTLGLEHCALATFTGAEHSLLPRTSPSYIVPFWFLFLFFFIF